MIGRRACAIALLCALTAPGWAHAQPAAQQDTALLLFTLEGALQYAVDHYPTVKAAVEQLNASSAGVNVARAAYLPHLDSLWQSNRATANNIFGQVLPQSVIPAMTGPVVSSASSQSVWGSATGALFSWEPFDFGLRRATVRNAEAAVAGARANQALTRLEVQGAVGAAFLAVVAAEQAGVAAEADVERRDVLARAVHTLADNQLRPGADASRADAERAAAQTRFIEAREALVLARLTFARTLGLAGDDVTVNVAGLLAPVPATVPPSAAAPAHPLALVRQAAVDLARSEEDVLSRTDRPRLFLQSSVFARGSGANFDGSLDGDVDGLGLDRANWAAGVQVVFPNLFDFASLRARRAGAAASTRAEGARHDEALLIVTHLQRAATARVDAARAIAANTPVQLAAAQQSETQARARYEAGLAGIVEVADTQSLLAQAEYLNSSARIEVWRALLAEAVAHGDLTSFASLVRSPGGVR
jgi:outer membrane protein TolC